MRTTVEDIKKIIDTSLDDATITAFATTAYNLIEASISNTSETMLTEIEKWLAAHFIASTRERVSKEEGAGGAYIKYAGEYGSDLRSTSYGQTAIVLDTTGALAILSGSKAKATIYAVTSKKY